MASLSDRLGQVIQTSKPQTKGLAGEIRAFAGDTSGWEIKDGVRQENGFAVCDGSTLDNSSGEYADFLARTGSLVLPNGPYRTREVDLNYNLSSLDSGSFTSRFMKGYFYTDDRGNWRLNFTGAFTLDVFDTFFYLRIQDIVGKDFGADNDDRQYFDVDCPFGGSNDQASGYARGGDNFFRISGDSSQTEYNVAGDIILDSKPTIANFDDYIEATPLISLYDNVGNVISTGNFQANGDATVNGDLTVGGEARLSSGQVDGDLQVNGEIIGGEATATQAGTVSTGDQVWSGNKNLQGNFSANNLKAGDEQNRPVTSAPTVDNTHVVVTGLQYTGFITLDSTAMNIGHNSGSREIKFSINESTIGSITNTGFWRFGPVGGNASHVFDGSIQWRSGGGTAGSLGNREVSSGRDRQYIVFNSAASSSSLFYGNDGNLRLGGVTSISTNGSNDGGTIVGTQTSDERIKDNIVDIDLGLNAVMALSPKRYDKQVGELNKHEVGFLAQEVQAVLPEAVYDTKEPLVTRDAEEETPTEEGETILAMEYTQLIPVLTKAIQEQQEQIEALKSEIELLKNN